jgi:L-aminopeptidase/D-esterase-like protein
MKAELARLAQMAQDGLARAIRPVHTPFDGDTVFALSLAPPGSVGDPAPGGSPFALLTAGSLAAEALARAVVKAVLAATGLHGVPAVSDLGAGASITSA